MRNRGKTSLLILAILWAGDSYSCTFCKNASAAANSTAPSTTAETQSAAAPRSDNAPVVVRGPVKPMGQLINGYLDSVGKPLAEPESERGTFKFNDSDGTVYGTSSSIGDSDSSSDSDD